MRGWKGLFMYVYFFGKERKSDLKGKYDMCLWGYLFLVCGLRYAKDEGMHVYLNVHFFHLS